MSSAIFHSKMPPNNRLRLLFAILLALSTGLVVFPFPEKTNIGPIRIPLGPNLDSAKPDTQAAYLSVYLPLNKSSTAILICPGGGYELLANEKEGSDIAQWLATQGIVGAVLEYRLPHGDPSLPLSDAREAMKLIRRRAKEWQIDPKRVGILGFSAGGHLASMLATELEPTEPHKMSELSKESSRPDFAVLIYPVITMGDKTHLRSRTNLLGASPSDTSLQLFSSEKQVSAQTPPVFLAHAADDTVVDPVNSQMFYDALLRYQVRAHYLKLPSGNHGLNGYQGVMWDRWQSQMIIWLIAEGFHSQTPK